MTQPNACSNAMEAQDVAVSTIEPVPEGVDYVSRILREKRSAPVEEPVPEGVDYVSRIL